MPEALKAAQWETEFVREWHRYVDANAGVARDIMLPMKFKGHEYTALEAKRMYDEIMEKKQVKA
jgi:hypothetical protein